MLRYLFRRPRTIRVPAHNGQFDIQKVSITKNPRIPISRFLSTFIISLCVFRTAGYLFSDGDAGRGWEGIKTQNPWSEQWKEAHARISQNGSSTKASQPAAVQEKDAIRLMLPVWVRRTKQAWFTEDDPQWKAFHQFATDEKLVLETKYKITAQVGEQLRFERYQGAVTLLQPRKTIIHLDVIIPVAPLAGYEVPCIFVQPSGEITYGWRRVPDSVGSKLNRVFHPVMLTKAFYAGCKEFVSVTYVITKARLTDRINSYKEDNSKSKVEGPLAPSSSQPRKVLTEEEKATQRLVVTRTNEQRMKRVLPFLRGEYGEHESRQAYRDFVLSMTYKGAIEMGCTVFRHHWIEGQMKLLQNTTTNVVVFRGFLDYEGERGTLHLEVSAFYDVSTQSLIGKPRIASATIVPNAQKWHSKNSPRAPIIASKAAQTTKPRVQDSVKRADPPRETAAAKSSQGKDEEE